MSLSFSSVYEKSPKLLSFLKLQPIVLQSDMVEKLSLNPFLSSEYHFFQLLKAICLNSVVSSLVNSNEANKNPHRDNSSLLWTTPGHESLNSWPCGASIIPSDYPHPRRFTESGTPLKVQTSSKKYFHQTEADLSRSTNLNKRL